LRARVGVRTRACRHERKGLVSVIIPTYNRPDTLKDTLESLFSQSYKDFEVIVVDDGSDIDITPITKGYAVRIIRQRHTGANAARNNGFRHSKGEFLLFCDDDIELNPQFLKRMVQTLRSNPDKAYAYCGFEIEGKILGMEPFNAEKLRKENCISGVSLIRRRKFPGFDPRMKRLQDWDLWLTMLEKRDEGVWVPRVLFRTKSRPFSISDDSHPTGWTYAHAYEVVRRKHRLPSPTEPLNALVSLYIHRKDLQSAYPEAQYGDYRRLIAWASDIVVKRFPDPAYRDLQQYGDFYVRLRGDSVSSERSELLSRMNEIAKEFRRMKDVELRRVTQQLDKVKAELLERDSKIRELEIERSKVSCECDKVKAELHRKAQDLMLLEIKSLSFQDIIQKTHVSPAWRLVEVYRTLLMRFAPPWTFRRRLVEFATSLLVRICRLIPRQQPVEVFPKSTIVADKLHYGIWKEMTARRLCEGKVRSPPTREKPVDIIIAVHNGHSVFRRCIESVLRYTAPPYRIIVMDDASSDPDLLTYLETLKALKHVVIIRNSDNQGYVRTVNQALQHSMNDVVLLNSDTVVTRDWLDKLYACAYSNTKIGSVSPLSNNATICSIPNFCERNRIPDGFDIDSFGDLVYQSSARLYPAIITNPGSCIYVKRQLIDEIGAFDEAFSPAYEEENDFCIRAFRAGYVAVLDDTTFIYHEGESSYSGKASDLKHEHQQLMERKNPGYSDLVQSFVRENPLRDIQERVRSRIIQTYARARPALLYLVHKSICGESPGGTELHCLQLVQNLKEYLIYVLYPEGQNLILREHTPLGVKQYTYGKPYSSQHCITNRTTERLFRRILRDFSIRLVHIQHMLGLPLSLIHVAKDEGIPVILSLNDFYYVCPQYMLLRNGMSYCNTPKDLDICDSCLHNQFGHPKGFQQSYRQYCRGLIMAVDLITCGSQATIDIYRNAYDVPEHKIHVIPHGYTPLNDPRDFDSRHSTRIAFVGSVTAPFKGRDLVLQLLSLNRRLEIEWHFFGIHSDIRPYLTAQGAKPVGKLVFHGRYDRELLPELLRQEGIGLVVLPYVQPETFSLVLSEVWCASLPVVAPDMCALGERIRQSGGGWLYPYGSDAKSVLELLYRIMDDNDEYYRRVGESQKIKVTTLSEYLESYRALYERILRMSWPERPARTKMAALPN